MRKYGFTLVELLAVVVIISVISLISIPIITNVIEKAKKGAAESSAISYIDVVEKQVMINKVDSSKNSINDGVYDVPMTGIIVKGESPSSGWLVIEKGQVTNYSLVIGNYVITKGETTTTGNTSTTKPEDGGSTSVWIYTDTDGDGTKNIGDKITVGTESFYIISNDGTNIKAFAEYNLYVGGTYSSTNSRWIAYGSEATGLQDSTMLGYAKGQAERKGTTAFSSDSQKGTKYSDYTGSIVETYVNAYKTKLESFGATINSASLITKEELKSLGCSFSYCTCSAAPSWIRTTAYWPDSANDTYYVWDVDSDGDCDNYSYIQNAHYGVRPVIIILTSEI